MSSRTDIEKFLDNMVDMIFNTKRTGREHGFRVCETDDSLRMSDICEGDKCSVALEKCPPRSTTFLDMHTHPPRQSITATLPSPSDTLNAIKGRIRFMCIGSPIDDGVLRCYEVDSDTEDARLFRKAMKDGKSSEAIKHLARVYLDESSMMKQVGLWEDLLLTKGGDDASE